MLGAERQARERLSGRCDARIDRTPGSSRDFSPPARSRWTCSRPGSARRSARHHSRRRHLRHHDHRRWPDRAICGVLRGIARCTYASHRCPGGTGRRANGYLPGEVHLRRDRVSPRSGQGFRGSLRHSGATGRPDDPSQGTSSRAGGFTGRAHSSGHDERQSLEPDGHRLRRCWRL